MLRSQADSTIYQANPTIAAGDFKVSIDGGATANPATLPAVTPASGKFVKVSLSADEMNGDNIQFYGSDAAGAEWMDYAINIQTAARQVDDLCFPTTSGRSLDVTATGAAGIDWANVEAPTTSLALTGTTIAVTQKVDVDTIKTNPVVNGGTITFPTTATLASTTNITAGTIATVTNLTNAPTNGDLTATMKTSVTTAATAATPIAASVTGAVGSVTGAVGSVTGAVGSVTANVNADVKKINGTTVNGDGSATPWGP